MPIRENGTKIWLYNYGIFIFMLSHYRPYQTSYIYLFHCSFRTISYIMIVMRQDSACDARIACDDPLPMQVIYPKGFSLA